MQISLYIGNKKKKDRIVNKELEKFIEGDRSARIKDLILKGLIFEGNSDIDEGLLDIRYMMGLNVEVKTVKNNYGTKETPKEKKSIESTSPDFSSFKLKNPDFMIDDDLEERI